MVTSLFYGAAN